MCLGCLSLTAYADIKVLVVGDSISAGFGVPAQQGWVHLLGKELQNHQPSLTFINASISGDTTQGGLTRLPKLLAQHQPDLTIIELGGNDGLRGTPLRLMHQNLQRMVRLTKAAQSDVLLVGMHIPPNYGAQYTEAFHEVFHRIAREEQVMLLPFFLEGIATDANLMQSDGIHPTAAAQPKMVDLIRPYLMQWLVRQ